MQDMLHTLRLPQRDAAGLPLPGDPDRSLSAVESVQFGLIWRVCRLAFNRPDVDMMALQHRCPHKLHEFLLRLLWEVSRSELEASGSR